MELYACGFNAHGQLKQQQGGQQDVRVFQEIYQATGIRLLAAFWSSTVICSGDTTCVLGHPASGPIKGLDGHDIAAILSDDIFGPVVLIKDGTMCKLEDCGFNGINSKVLVKLTANIACLASAGNGTICVCSRNVPAMSTTVHSYNTFNSLSSGTPEKSNTLSEQIMDITASHTAFAALTAGGEVYTWGDPRYPVLGRVPTADEPASLPVKVSFFGGLPIRKLSSNGYLFAALSASNDLYIFGTNAPGATSKINCLPLQDQEVALVDIDGGTDILDVAVGAGHVIALTDRRELWAIGENSNGQLGLGGSEFAKNWVRVKGLDGKRVTAVGAGYWNSFALVEGVL